MYAGLGFEIEQNGQHKQGNEEEMVEEPEMAREYIEERRILEIGESGECTGYVPRYQSPEGAGIPSRIVVGGNTRFVFPA